MAGETSHEQQEDKAEMAGLWKNFEFWIFNFETILKLFNF
jgi:hypothetical protein